MDIRQLAAFVAVFEERNITAAAQRLFVSQPTLSVTIRQLEEALGTELFLRQARGVEVSEAARTLYPRARALLAEADGLRNMFRQASARQPLHLGVEGDVSAEQVEGFVSLAQQAVPNLLLHLEEGCVGDARLAVEEFCCEDELFVPVWEDPYVLALPPGVEDAQDCGWITCPTHPSHQRLMTAYGSAPVVAQASTLNLALRLVSAGIGAAILPASLLAGAPAVRSGTLNLPLPIRRIGLCHSAQALEHPAVRGLYDFLRAREAA
ncbi:LysR family transcriptional regulator [Pseudomonas nitroreducens]|uniref:LysR family transcriptional regulator n=1 Tax=Pseudomonas nitroreducens TaxID=46680 RepID=UPI0020A22661|nr:LysR family transcriptional regulator [Pseudomonas nitroreducens]MCP1622289.1 DNA-binding transcriptional LysR family regulator [Pseudomonas nitroreducens]